VERIGLFPSSGKIRCIVADPLSILTHLKNVYFNKALDTDESDGLNLTFAEWRFKISLSTTESMILLHVESRGDIELMHAKTQELLNEIGNRNSSERQHTPISPVTPPNTPYTNSNSY
jgi:phosphomannomutase